MIHVSSWVEALMTTYPDYLLGGFGLSEADSWMSMFTEFWENFKAVRPSHPIYAKSAAERACTIPVAIHGDEGRSLAKVPLMVISFQAMISSSGPENLSSTQHLAASAVFHWHFGLNFHSRYSAT